MTNPHPEAARRVAAFNLPNHAFGREEEIRLLTEAFRRAESGRIEVVLVEGPPGIGKSRLVSEINDVVSASGGSVVAGKFDQAGPEAPYAAVVVAFRELVLQNLGQPDPVLEARRERLLSELGGNARVIVEAMPELEHVIGTFPPLPELPAIEAQNRFRFAFRLFVGAFSGPGHPLVLVLDDLQWADSASLELLLHLTSGLRGHFLLIGTVRDDEIGPEHPLRSMLARLDGAEIGMERLQLTSLEAAVISQMISTAFSCAPERADELGALMADRTDGNPLLVRETLERLHHDGLLAFDSDARRWTWDIEQVRAHAISDNVAELMAQRLGRLSPNSQRAVSFAAWLGNTFDTNTLSLAVGSTPDQLDDPLHEAVTAGIVAVNASGSGPTRYTFLHDRVQSVAGDLVPVGRRMERHAAIGRAMLKGWSREELRSRVFEALRHLGPAVELLDPEEQKQVGELGLLAGRRAARSMDFPTAVRHLRFGLKGVGGQQGGGGRLGRDLHEELGRSLSFLGDFTGGAYHLSEALDRTATDLERARIHRTRVVCATLQGDEGKVLESGVAGLASLGVSLPLNPGAIRVGLELLASRVRLRGRDPTDLLRMPELSAEEPKVALELLMDLSTVAYSRSAELAGLVFLKMTNLILRHGRVDLASYVFAIYGQVIASGLGRYEEAYEFGEMAVEMSDRYGNSLFRGRARFTCAVLLNHWLYDAREDIALFNEARALLMESGDLLWVAYTDTQFNMLGVFLGDPLDEVIAQAEKGLSFAEASHFQDVVPYHLSTRLWALDLAGRTEESGSWDAELHKEAELESEIERSDFTPGIAFSRILRLYGLALIGESERALQAVTRLLPPHAMAGQLFEAETLFAEGLAHMGRVRNTSGRERSESLKRLKKIHRRFEKWSRLSPINFESRRLILEAGFRWTDHAAATRILTDATDSAEAHGYRHLVAISEELLARVHFLSGRHEAAHRALERALESYQAWGARGKLQRMKEEFPWLEIPEDFAAVEGEVRPKTGGDATDVVSLLQVTQSFSEEVRLEELLERVLAACVESAGARRGALVVEGEAGLVVEAIAAHGENNAVVKAAPLEGGGLAATVVRYVARTGESVVLDDAVSDSRFASDPYVQRCSQLSVLCCPLIYRGRRTGLLYLENDLERGAFGGRQVRLVEVLANQAAISLEHARVQEGSEDMIRSFARFVPKEMVEILGKANVVDVRPGDAVSREMTVLFSDLRGYTRFTELLDPREGFSWLNAYLERISPIVGFYGGFIDKFVGDAIMALFPGDVTNALRAAVGMLQELGPLNVGRGGDGAAGFRAGVGLHFGSVMLGSVGSSRRLDITAIGDAVNLASRIEAVTKLLDASLLITDAVCRRLQKAEEFSIRPVGRVRVEGRDAPLELYEVLDGDTPDRAESKGSICETMLEGIRLFQERSFRQAEEVFGLCLETRADDAVAHLYRTAARAFVEDPPGEDWFGELRLPKS